jgi:hypothetical protein
LPSRPRYVRNPTVARHLLLFLAFLDQKLITGHLPDRLLCLRFGSLAKFAHGGLLPLQTASGRNVSLSPPLEAGSTQCNNPVAERN